MRDSSNIPAWALELALVVTTIIWGGAFVVLKGALDAVSPGWLLAARFFLAGAILAAVFWRRLRDNLDGSHLVVGLMVGLPEGLAFLIQNVGLTDTTPGRNALLTATYCVMVPFVDWLVQRRRPGANNLVAAFMCLVGVGLVSLRGDLSPWLSGGDWLTLLSALFFALNIVAVGRYGSAHDSVTLTIVMFFVSSAVSLAYALAREPLPHALDLGADFWLQLAYLVVLASVVALLIQNVAQKKVDPSRAALLLSLESVFAMLFSVLLYGEPLTPQLALGFALVFSAVLVSELAGGRGKGRA